MLLHHVIANPRPRGQSRSLRVADAFLDGFRQAHPEAQIDEVNLFDVELPMTDARDVNTRIHQFQGQQLEGEEKRRFDRFMRFIDPLQRCDALLITTPMWNFGPPWRLKQWIDTVTQARVTFEYTPDGPRGLLSARGAIVGARGGAYPDDGDPRQTSDFLIPYLERALAWIGIEPVDACFAQGVDADRDNAEQILRDAEERARALGASR